MVGFGSRNRILARSRDSMTALGSRRSRILGVAFLRPWVEEVPFSRGGITWALGSRRSRILGVAFLGPWVEEVLYSRGRIPWALESRRSRISRGRIPWALESRRSRISWAPGFQERSSSMHLFAL